MGARLVAAREEKFGSPLIIAIFRTSLYP